MHTQTTIKDALSRDALDVKCLVLTSQEVREEMGNVLREPDVVESCHKRSDAQSIGGDRPGEVFVVRQVSGEIGEATLVDDRKVTGRNQVGNAYVSGSADYMTALANSRIGIGRQQAHTVWQGDRGDVSVLPRDGDGFGE